MKYNGAQLEAKIQKPKIMKNMILRTQLIERISQLSEKLIIFHATMGFGKTVLMNSYGMECGGLQAWYHMDYLDNDIITFTRYLMASIQSVLPEFTFDLSHYQGMEEKERMYEVIGHEFAGALEAADKRYLNGRQLNLMLDDFQEINNEEISNMLDILLNYMPDSIRLFITTKGTLPRFALRHLVNENAYVFSGQDLAFQESEVLKLVEQIPLVKETVETAAVIYEYSEGWPAGVMFLCLYLRQQKTRLNRETITEICRESRIHDFIMFDLFKKLPFDIQNFLVKTSLLEYLSKDVCNAVAGVRNSSSILDYLIQEGLFIQKMEGRSNTYRYHSLFKNFLENQLTASEKDELRNKIAVFFLNTDQKEQAAEYGILVGNYDVVGKAMESVGLSVLEDGRLNVLKRWLHFLQSGVPELSPKNMVIAGLCYINDGDAPMGKTYLDRAVLAAEQMNDEGQYLFAVMKEAEYLRNSREADEAAALLQKVLDCHKKKYNRVWFSLAYEMLLSLLYMKSEKQAAILATDILSHEEEYCMVQSQKTLQIKREAEFLMKILKAEEDGKLKALLEDTRKLQGIPTILIHICAVKYLLKKYEGPWETSDQELAVELTDQSKETSYSADLRVIAGSRLLKNGQEEEGSRLLVAAIDEMYQWKTKKCVLPEADAQRCRMVYMVKMNGTEKTRDGRHLIANCFGEFKISILETGEEIKWRTKKAQECVAYFLHLGDKSVTREELLAALWNLEEIPEKEVAALHNILSSIRKSLSPYGMEDLIQYQDKRYFLKEGSIGSDVQWLNRIIKLIEEKDKKGLAAKEAGLERYWNKPYMGSMESEWCSDERSYYECRMFEGACLLGSYFMEQGRYEEAAVWLKRAVEQNPYMVEPAHLLLCCYGNLKDAQRVKQTYEKIRRIVSQELGEGPDPVLEQTYLDNIKLCK